MPSSSPTPSVLGQAPGPFAPVGVSPTPTTSSTQAPAPAPTAGVLDGWVGAALIPALIAAIVALAVASAKSRREDQARVRTSVAEAYRAYSQYKEFPYVIRRRDHAQPGPERTRISEALRAVQAELAFHQRWTEVEDTALGEAYNRLVTQARKVVGSAMRDAWNTAPIRSDPEMNMGLDVIDLSALKTEEDRFLAVSRDHVRRVGRGFVLRILFGLAGR